MISARGFGLVRKGLSKFNNSITVEHSGRYEITLSPGVYTYADGRSYELTSSKTISMEGDQDYAKYLEVGWLRDEDTNETKLWSDEVKFAPVCLGENIRPYVEDSFTIPSGFEYLSSHVGALWLCACPEGGPMDVNGQKHPELCDECSLKNGKGDFAPIKSYAKSYVSNHLIFKDETHEWRDQIRGLRHYQGPAYDTSTKNSILELPQIPYRGDELDLDLYYDPDKDAFEEKREQEYPNELMVEKKEQTSSTPIQEVKEVVKTHGMPKLGLSVREFIDMIVKHQRGERINFPHIVGGDKLRTQTEFRELALEEVERRLDDFLEQFQPSEKTLEKARHRFQKLGYI